MITPNYHQNIGMIIFENILGIIPMSLSDTLIDNKNQDCYIIYNYQHNICKGLNQWDFVTLGNNII